MRRFLLKLLLFSVPFQLLALSFVVFDPFKVVYDYSAFRSHNPVWLNVDYLATETYLDNREERDYDAFIFGSSRTLGFRTEEWTRHLPGATPFRYSASRESLFGVWGKVRLIDRRGDAIRHALILAEPVLLQRARNSTGHIYIKHPRVSGGSWGEFYLTFFSAYLSDFFFVKYLDYELFGDYRDYMEGAINANQSRIDPTTNDLVLVDQEAALERDPESYYADMKREFRRVRRGAPEVHEPVIGPEQRELLEKIRSVFDQHGTCYQVVVSPNYDQASLHSSDLAVLREVFGEEHVHDYSGPNAITASMRNYYEPYHFRPRVGARILEEIYAEEGRRCPAGGVTASRPPRAEGP